MYEHIDEVLQPFLSAVSPANAQLSACVWSRPSLLQQGSLAGCWSSAPPEIDHFVTIGSPLGLPIVTQHVREEFSNTTVPRQVRQWTNLADPGDRVALDCSLADDYRPTPGGIRVQDDLVHNGYVD